MSSPDSSLTLLRLFLAWAATTRDDDFIRMEGLKLLVSRPKHRKELVAGGLAEYLTAGTLTSFFFMTRSALTSLQSIAALLIDWGTAHVTSGLHTWTLTAIASSNPCDFLDSH